MKTTALLLVGVLLGAAVVALMPRETITAQADTPPPVSRDHRDRSWIGISYTTDQHGGWLIQHVHVGSPAWNAGLLPGDTITAVEVRKDGKAIETGQYPHGQTLSWLKIGLETSAPGTAFRVLVKRGQTSMDTEKALAVDFPRDKIEIPAAQAVVDHIRRLHKQWQQAEVVWMEFTSASYNEFSDAQMKQMQVQLAQLQIADLEERARRADLERAALVSQIVNAAAQRDMALTQRKALELQQHEAQTNGVLGFMSIFFKLIAPF